MSQPTRAVFHAVLERLFLLDRLAPVLVSLALPGALILIKTRPRLVLPVFLGYLSKLLRKPSLALS
jgi:hypothetical protein